jgi:superfamily II DNA/RNA helicase
LNTPPGATTSLVLTPTRELAIQVRGEIERLGRYTPLRTALIYGGVSFDGQRRALADGVEIIVGTPGRVLDLYRQGIFKLQFIERIVLDECDRMFDLGFRPDIERVLRATKPKRQQLLLFSATIDQNVLRIADSHMSKPEIVKTVPEKLTVDNVDQFYVSIAPDRKRSLLAELIRCEEKRGGFSQAIVFSRTKKGCERLSKDLRKLGLPAQEIHGDLRQKARERVINDLREKKIQLLVATDVAARGLDVSGISHIFNYDIPEYPEDYVHRIGRTARMGARGRAFTLVTADQGHFLTQIEKLTNVLIEEMVIEGFTAGVPRASVPKTQGTGKVLFDSSSLF